MYQSNEKDDIRLIFLQQVIDEKAERWSISLIDSHGSMHSSSPVEGKEKLGSSATSKVTSPSPVFKGEKMIVASIVNTNKSMFSSRINIATEDELKEATNYEQVYMFSIEMN